jgi:hypothetical protein
MLIRLAYFSRNRLDLRNGPMRDRFAELLSASAANNQRDGITGALIYDSKWFAQVLEGHEQAVSATFERILRDDRHSDVALIGMQPVAERRFAMSAMAGVSRGEDNADLFRHYGENDRFDPQVMRADRLSDLIEALVDRSLERTPWTTRNATNAA